MIVPNKAEEMERDIYSNTVWQRMMHASYAVALLNILIILRFLT